MFLNPENQELKQKFDDLSKKERNPFTLMMYWLKYELIDLDVISALITKRSDLDRRLRELVRQLKTDMTDFNRMERGSFTFGTVFSSKETVEVKLHKLRNSIPQQ